MDGRKLSFFFWRWFKASVKNVEGYEKSIYDEFFWSHVSYRGKILRWNGCGRSILTNLRRLKKKHRTYRLFIVDCIAWGEGLTIWQLGGRISCLKRYFCLAIGTGIAPTEYSTAYTRRIFVCSMSRWLAPHKIPHNWSIIVSTVGKWHQAKMCLWW